MTIDCKQAAALLGGWDHILILTHKRPDGDTIGCAVGLCALLRQLGKTAWLHPNEDATELFTPYLEGYIAPAGFAFDKVVAVDVATLDLLTDAERAVADSRGVDLCVDHHPSNTGYAKACCVEADKAACGEIIYKLVGELGTLDDEIAKMLYVAVSTDTGCFAYANTTANTHAVAAALLERNIPYREINKRHFRTKSRKRMKLETILIQSLEELEDGQVVIGALSLADMARVGATEVDAEDIAAVLGQIEGVKASATLRELKGGECKISLRTDSAYLDACAVCALLGGGGHKAAAGATVKGDVPAARAVMAEAIRKVLHGS